MRIKTVAEYEAVGPVKIEYDRLIENFGMVPNVTKVFSISPEIFQLHNEMYGKLMVEPSQLPKPVKQIIALLVSAVNCCDYCLIWHSRFLMHLNVDDELIDTIRRDFRQAPLDDKTMKLLEYVDCVARDSSAITDERVNALADCGFSDQEILEVTTLVGYMSFLTRIINALGVEIEPSQAGRTEQS